MPIYDYSGVDFSSLSQVQDAVTNSLISGDVLDENFYNLAAQGLSKSIPSGTISLFSSGGNSAQTVGNLSLDSNHYTTIQSSDVGKFFDSTAVLQALEATYESGLTVNGFSSAVDALDGADPKSLLGNISLEYAKSVSGDVYAIVRDGSPVRIFSQIELQALLDNPNVTSINGISRTDLLRYGDGATLRVFSAVQESSDFATSFLLSDAFVNGRIGNNLAVLNDYFDAAGISTNGNDFYDSAVETLNFANSKGLSIQDFSGVPRALFILEKAGVAGDIVGFAVTAQYAVHLYNNGQSEEANIVLQDFAAGLAGGAAGGYAGAALGLAILGIIVPEPTTTTAGVVTILAAIAGGVGGEALAQSILDDLRIKLSSGEALTAEDILEVVQSQKECFAAGTSISLVSGDQRPIEMITEGDVVTSYDEDGNLVPGRVVRTFKNEVSHLLDVHGLKVTPGHVTLCGEGRFAGRHVPIIDILLSDGALVRESGALVRMSTNKPAGDLEDQMVKVSYAETSEDLHAGKLKSGQMRVGTLLFDKDGVAVSVLDCIRSQGLEFDAATGLVSADGSSAAPLNWFGPLPRPEDYILRRSRETLEDILTSGEWEGRPSELIAGRLKQTAERYH